MRIYNYFFKNNEVWIKIYPVWGCVSFLETKNFVAHCQTKKRWRFLFLHIHGHT